MTKIYGHKWASIHGDMREGEKYSNSFLQWCKDTEALTDQQWSKALEGVKTDYAKTKNMGKEPWPPNSIEFLMLAKPPRSPSGIGSTAYIDFDDPAHPRNDPNSPEYSPKALTDQTKIERNREKGRSILAQLKTQL